MDQAALAAKLSDLPSTCLKCHAGPPWLQMWATFVECRCCGWTGFLRVVREEEAMPTEDRSVINRQNAMRRWHAKLTPA